MDFIPIFAPYLHSVVFDKEPDEFTKFIDFLMDTMQLEAYFNENQNVLKFYDLSIEDAVLQTAEIAVELYDYIEKNKKNLDQIFEPLKNFGNNVSLFKMKHRISWIRLYAIQIESKYYVITGGAIKQSQKMFDHPETQKQLFKMERVRDFLLEQGISNINGLFELINE